MRGDSDIMVTVFPFISVMVSFQVGLVTIWRLNLELIIF
jgi:hypothetical protein